MNRTELLKIVAEDYLHILRRNDESSKNYDKTRKKCKKELKEQKRVTKASLKAFIKSQVKDGNLFSKNLTSFDGMTDCVTKTEGARWVKVNVVDMSKEHTFGIPGVWLVGGGRDKFSVFEEGEMKGIQVLNCCGKSVVAGILHK